MEKSEQYDAFKMAFNNFDSRPLSGENLKKFYIDDFTKHTVEQITTTIRAESLTDPVGPPSDSHRVYRGGCWEDHARLCRSAYRYGIAPNYSEKYVGFRILKSLL